MRTKKRGLSLFITLCLIVGMLPQTAFATQGATIGTSSLCEHHTTHDETCGYVEAAEGTPCTHEHSEDCYEITESCTHTHTADCYPVLDSGVSGMGSAPLSLASQKQRLLREEIQVTMVATPAQRLAAAPPTVMTTMTITQPLPTATMRKISGSR